jgi:hypothetical protein
MTKTTVTAGGLWTVTTTKTSVTAIAEAARAADVAVGSATQRAMPKLLEEVGNAPAMAKAAGMAIPKATPAPLGKAETRAAEAKDPTVPALDPGTRTKVSRAAIRVTRAVAVVLPTMMIGDLRAVAAGDPEASATKVGATGCVSQFFSAHAVNA